MKDVSIETEKQRMHYPSDTLLAMLSSAFALLLSLLAFIPDINSAALLVTFMSAIIFMITGLIKLIDLCVDKFKKWGFIKVKKDDEDQRSIY